MNPHDLPEMWRERADSIEPYNPGAAHAYRVAAGHLQCALSEHGDEALTLGEASRESGVPAETLRKQIASGRVPNAGRKHAPRVRRADLPRRTPKVSSVDVDTLALGIHRRLDGAER